MAGDSWSGGSEPGVDDGLRRLCLGESTAPRSTKPEGRALAFRLLRHTNHANVSHLIYGLLMRRHHEGHHQHYHHHHGCATKTAALCCTRTLILRTSIRTRTCIRDPMPPAPCSGACGPLALCCADLAMFDNWPTRLRSTDPNSRPSRRPRLGCPSPRDSRRRLPARWHHDPELSACGPWTFSLPLHLGGSRGVALGSPFRNGARDRTWRR